MAAAGVPEFRDVPDRPNPYTMYPWLAIAASTAVDVADGKLHPAWLACLGLAAFVFLYIAAIWIRWRTDRTLTACALLAALGAITLAMNIGYGADMIILAPLLAIACGAVVPWPERQAPPLPLIVVFLVACTAAVVTWAQGATPGNIAQAWYPSALAGMITAIIYRFISAVSELRRTREELARSAVDAERLRFARDLHDLLGHTLSVMVVKAQAVRKLASVDPSLAAAQAADIETIGRDALTEVREAVTGYRGRGLSRELEAARTALADAGFTAIIRQDGRPVPDEAGALLGWVVREGVTNVIKHSGGHQCEIDVGCADGEARVEVADDGEGAGGAGMSSGAGLLSGAGLPSGGHGLAGLTERITAAGGRVEAGPRRGGGFRVTAVVPVLVPARSGPPA
jgi:two-component system, NarL family, sensor histidine kinase DesK